ncbi:hypothetical protein MNY66_16505 (plasmid) [Moellerella wisconsensis]|uniref:Uncharacterized protein n=1 Tax=Moellerella wisconsensis TaxID=158849 RepID=A0ACD3YCY2_9GAMM|nr:MULTISPECIES: hypothetical protein [Morganellaceae]QCJ72225.1 hypothetical protein C9446_20710 [Providencia heimbachae]UNH40644.1 hypothetical protein MNY70_17555 [Moellerella wisconsensis]UNH44348.1 hypothetical protein MNY66_16505 [Moellerella wisconsensis]
MNQELIEKLKRLAEACPVKSFQASWSNKPFPETSYQMLFSGDDEDDRCLIDDPGFENTVLNRHERSALIQYLGAVGPSVILQLLQLVEESAISRNDDLSEMEGLARQATEGPWRYDPRVTTIEFGEPDRVDDYDAEDAGIITCMVSGEIKGDVEGVQRNKNGKYIAAVHPQAVIGLIQRVRKAEGRK